MNVNGAQKGEERIWMGITGGVGPFRTEEKTRGQEADRRSGKIVSRRCSSSSLISGGEVGEMRIRGSDRTGQDRIGERNCSVTKRRVA